MRKHVFVLCVILVNLVSGLYGMESEQVSDQGAREEAKEGAAENNAMTPAQKILLSSGILARINGKLVLVQRRAPRRGVSPVPREHQLLRDPRMTLPRFNSQLTYLPRPE